MAQQAAMPRRRNTRNSVVLFIEPVTPEWTAPQLFTELLEVRYSVPGSRNLSEFTTLRQL
ncbi:MAG: hypothetical protein F2634_08095 [Actinobacteria bacterium]|nr:hypothetical protein [Actinomycetota bacterium]